MKARAQKWGNSLAVRIPKAIAEQAGVREQDELYIDVCAGVIRLRVGRRRPVLAELLEKVTGQNRHGEVSLGSPVGREPW